VPRISRITLIKLAVQMISNGQELISSRWKSQALYLEASYITKAVLVIMILVAYNFTHPPVPLFRDPAYHKSIILRDSEAVQKVVN
jgi:hypothetical protein